MKATMYSKDGKVLKKMECVRFESYCGAFHILTFEEVINSYGDKWLITNLPISVQGINYNGREPDPDDKGCNIRLLSDSGEVVKEWLDAQGVFYNGDIVGFKVGGEWFSVCGNLTLAPYLKGL